MTRPGQIVLFRFPQTDFESGKLRPALVIGKLPGRFGDWLVSCPILPARHAVEDNDALKKLM